MDLNNFNTISLSFMKGKQSLIKSEFGIVSFGLFSIFVTCFSSKTFPIQRIWFARIQQYL